MAIVVETPVPQASKDVADRFNESIEAAMMQMGGPPAGLMVHFTRPAGDGFLLCNVWRSEAEMQPFHHDVVLPRLAYAGLTPEESLVSPVWVFARP
jgi:hypothetical protein